MEDLASDLIKNPKGGGGGGYQDEYLNIIAIFTYIAKNPDHICILLLKQQFFSRICKELEKQRMEKNICF
jgi:hypothetical protein